MALGGSNVRLSLVGVTGTTAEIIYTIDTTGRYEDGYLIVFNENNAEISRTSSFRAYGNSSGSQNVTGIVSGHLYTVKFYSTDLGVYSESTVEIDLRSGDPAYAVSSSSTATSVNIIVSPISSAAMEADGTVVVESVSDGIKESIGYKSSDSSASITLVGLDQNTEYTFSVTYYDPGLASSVTNAVNISTSELGTKQGPKLYGNPGKNLCSGVVKYNNNSMGFRLYGIKNKSGISKTMTLSFSCQNIVADTDVKIYLYRSDGVGDNLGAVGPANWSVSPNGTNSAVLTLSDGMINGIVESGGGIFRVYKSGIWANSVAEDVQNAQIEIGNTATAYEPYIGAEEITKLYGGILGESTKITKLYGGVGKNLFNKDAAPTVKSSPISRTILDTGIRLTCVTADVSGERYEYCAYTPIEASKVAGKKLTLSFDAEGHTQDNKYRAYIGLCRADGTNYVSKSGIPFSDNGHHSVSWTVVEEDGKPYIRIVLYLYSGVVTRTVGEYIDYTNIQLEVGDETTYEPFVGSKLIHVSRPDKVYGYVTYYTDVNHTTTTTEPLKSQTEVNSLAGNSGNWSATVNGETVANSDITGVVLGSLVSTIPDWFLADCDNLTSLEMDQSSVTSIPNRFMAGCTSITDGASVVLPSSLTSIGDYFMYGCNGLTSTPVFLDSLTTIGRAFMNDCTNIKAIMLPSSLTSIGQEMLSVCNNLESVYVGGLSADIAAADSSGIYSFSVLTSGVPAYTNGIKILGDSSVIDEWTTKFPNRTSTPFRKLVSSESDGVFMIMADETGTMVIKNRWTTNILVKNKTQDTEEVSVAPMYTTNVQVNASDMVVVSESSIDSTFRSWATNTLNYTPPFVTGVSSHIVSMPAMNSFTIDTAGTTAGDFFFAGFNNGGSLTSLPAGSFDTGSITTAGSHFFMSFNVNGKLTSLPVGSFDTSNITTVDNYFFSHFNNRGSITSLPANSFDISNISVAHNYFFMSFNYGGELTSLPAGSFDTGSITTAGDFFFAGFNAQVLGSPSIIGKLASLPIGSFNTRNITTVGTNCFMEFNYGGCLPKSTSSYHTNFINPSSSSIDAYYGTGSSGSTTAVSIASGAPFYYYQN